MEETIGLTVRSCASSDAATSDHLSSVIDKLYMSGVSIDRLNQIIKISIGNSSLFERHFCCAHMTSLLCMIMLMLYISMVYLDRKINYAIIQRGILFYRRHHRYWHILNKRRIPLCYASHAFNY